MINGNQLPPRMLTGFHGDPGGQLAPVDVRPGGWRRLAAPSRGDRRFVAALLVVLLAIVGFGVYRATRPGAGERRVPMGTGLMVGNTLVNLLDVRSERQSGSALSRNGRFLVATVVVEDYFRAGSVSAADFVARTADGRRFAAESGAGGGLTAAARPLGPGETLRTTVVFDVPAGPVEIVFRNEAVWRVPA